MIVRHLGAAAFCLLIAVPVLFASQAIPDLGYDVVGGRAFPEGLAIILIGFAMTKLALAGRGLVWRSAAARQTGPRAEGWRREQIVVLVTTVAYVALILTGRINFTVLSIGYIAASGMLARPTWRSIVESAGMSALVALILLGLQIFFNVSMLGG
jgi:hypothetical protein